jgi:Fe-S-cluster containining protein
LTDGDVRRIARRTGHSAVDIVRFVDRHGIDMDDEPESFVRVRQGRCVMVLRHQRGGCRYLGEDGRCGIYGARPLGCRIFPFDPGFSRQGKLRRLHLIPATECRYELDGENDLEALRTLHERYEAATVAYHAKVLEWNARQKRRLRAGQKVETSRRFLEFLGLLSEPEADLTAC